MGFGEQTCQTLKICIFLAILWKYYFSTLQHQKSSLTFHYLLLLVLLAKHHHQKRNHLIMQNKSKKQYGCFWRCNEVTINELTIIFRFSSRVCESYHRWGRHVWHGRRSPFCRGRRWSCRWVSLSWRPSCPASCSPKTSLLAPSSPAATYFSSHHKVTSHLRIVTTSLRTSRPSAVFTFPRWQALKLPPRPTQYACSEK